MNPITLLKFFLIDNIFKKASVFFIAIGIFILHLCFMKLFFIFNNFIVSTSFEINDYYEWNKFFCSYDCRWYLDIFNNGYSEPYGDQTEIRANIAMEGRNWPFFPVFPFSAKILNSISNIKMIKNIIPDLEAFTILQITSGIYFFLAIYTFMKLSERELGKTSIVSTGLIIAFNPLSFYVYTGYSESTFLFFNALAFYFLKQQKWIHAGFAGAFVSGSRLVGVFFVLAYLANWQKVPWLHKKERAQFILGGILCPLGLSLFMLYLYAKTGDALIFKHTTPLFAHYPPSNPLRWYIMGIMNEGSFYRYYAILASLALFFSGYFLWNKQYDYAVYLLAATIIPMTSSLIALPRYIWWQLPFLFCISSIVQRNKYFLTIYLMFSCYLLMLMMFAWGYHAYFAV